MTAWLVFGILRNTPARTTRLRELAERRPDGRVRIYQQLIVSVWCMAAVAAVPLLSDPGMHLRDYGLGAPPPVMAGLAAFTVVALALALWARYRGFGAQARARLNAGLAADSGIRRMDFLLARTEPAGTGRGSAGRRRNDAGLNEPRMIPGIDDR